MSINMDTRIKLVLDIIGILISLVGFGLLLRAEKYLVSGLILLLLIILVIYAIKLARSKPYQVKSVAYDYEFCDEGASLTKISKLTVLIPKEKNLTKIDDLGIGSDGQISEVYTNNGTPNIKNDGGAISVTTTFDTPLKIGSEYTHVLNYQGKGCFPDQKENIVHPTIHKMEKAIIKIKFHENRRPSNFKAIHRIDGKTDDVTNENVDINNLCYMFTFVNPPRGSVFELKWEW